MTLLDAMISVGGLSEYAAGNKARLVRFNKATGKQTEYALRIADLLKKGESKANVRLEPGDVIIIQQVRDTQGIFGLRSEEHTSELQSLMRISYAVFCLYKTK